MVSVSPPGIIFFVRVVINRVLSKLSIQLYLLMIIFILSRHKYNDGGVRNR